jgi:hypothetical protein
MNGKISKDCTHVLLPVVRGDVERRVLSDWMHPPVCAVLDEVGHNVPVAVFACLEEKRVPAAGCVVYERGGRGRVEWGEDGSDGGQVASHARVLQGAQSRKARLLLLVGSALKNLRKEEKK